MVTHPLTPDVLPKLGTDFEQRVFKAALLSLEQEANPLRLNHFATTLRELSRIVLARLAPDTQIKACSWYSQASGEPEITRKQRIAYAVQAGLSESFVMDTLALDVNTLRQDLLNSITALSKYRHIEPGVFSITGNGLERTVAGSLEAFFVFLEMVKECRQSVRDAVGEEAEQILHDELLSNTILELDQLATHYNVENTQIEAVKITLMNATKFDLPVEMDPSIARDSGYH